MPGLRFPEGVLPHGRSPDAPKSVYGPLSEELPTSAAALPQQVFLGSDDETFGGMALLMPPHLRTQLRVAITFGLTGAAPVTFDM